MAIPQPDRDQLIAELNSLRNQGLIVTNEFRIRNLQKKVAAIAKEDSSMGRACQASLWCLTGDIDSMLSAGDDALRLDPDGFAALHHVITLINSGLFTRARELFGRLDSQMLKSSVDLWSRGYGCLSFARLIDLSKGMDVVDSETAMIATATQKVLDQTGVSEEDVTRMMDIAGAVLHERGLLMSGEPQIRPYVSHGSVNISLPVRLSAEEVAELEWEFCLRLFAEMPEAPAHAVQVGFCMGRDHGNAI